MSDIRYYEERPCEHGRMQAHYSGNMHRAQVELMVSGEDPDQTYEQMCPGGSRREITVDYSAGGQGAYDAWVKLRVKSDPPSNDPQPDPPTEEE